MKKILLLGGTNFIGRNLVERLQNMDAYDIALFNRQRTHPELFPDVTKIKGDRETRDIEQITNTHWDYVIDISCYYPNALTGTLACLKERPDKYIFISTCSVYDNANYPIPLRNEHAATLPCTDDQRIDRTAATYGNRKAECERILQSSGLNYLILRPALVYGRYDPTGRFYYWLYQVEQNDPLLVPENGERIFSLTYVDDLVETIVRALTLDVCNNIYNTITLPTGSIRQIIDCAQELLGKESKVINATADFLKKHNISQWTDMPLWINNDYFTYDNKKLQDDFGIELTDFRHSVQSTIDYYATLNWHKPGYGMEDEKRKELLDS